MQEFGQDRAYNIDLYAQIQNLLLQLCLVFTIGYKNKKQKKSIILIFVPSYGDEVGLNKLNGFFQKLKFELFILNFECVCAFFFFPHGF